MGAVKQNYFLVSNPAGEKKTILAIDKFHAISVAEKMDKYFYETHEYTAIKSKI